MTYIASRAQYLRNLSSGYVLLGVEVVVAFVLTPFIVFRLGPAAYGLWALLISVVGYMGLIDIGIRGTVGRYINHYLARNDLQAVSEVSGTAATVLSLLSLLALGVAVVIGVAFAAIFPKTTVELQTEALFSLPLMAIALWVTLIHAIQRNLLAAKEKVHLSNGFGVVILLIRASGVYVVLSQGYGIRGLVAVQLVLVTVNYAAHVLMVRHAYREHPPRLFDFSRARIVELWRFTAAASTSRIASMVAANSAPIIAMWLLGPEAVAVYSVALTLIGNATRLLEQANASIFPSVNKAGARSDMSALQLLYLRYMNIAFAIGSLVYVGLSVFGQNFLLLWVGGSYDAGTAVIITLSISYLLQAVGSTGNITLGAMDQIGPMMRIGVGEALASILLSAVLPGIFGLGLLGLALGAALPRVFTNIFIYPTLTFQLVGPGLRAAAPSVLMRNILLCCLVALVQVIVYKVIDTREWSGLCGAIILICLLHIPILMYWFGITPLQLSRALRGRRRQNFESQR